MLPVWVYRVIAAGAASVGMHLAFDNWKIEAAVAMTVAGLPPSYQKAMVQGVGRGTVWTLKRVAVTGAKASRAGLGWAAGTRVAVGASALTAGYMIGAVGGIAISQKIWGDRGARHAMDFYTGKGKYGEYFDVVTNTSSLLNYYFSGE